ncbi:hypothetical protein [Thalassotalea maritima]|uniref:hypothetical protein n=1 Tax=Thalassotalea maritima TaxID=3242416 RepID=UPI0035279BB7
MKLLLSVVLTTISMVANAQAKLPAELTHAVLSSRDVLSAVGKTIHNNTPPAWVEEQLLSHGDIVQFKCYDNHDSDKFDTVVCHVIQEKLINGSVWEFYFFLEGSDWVNTNVILVQVLPDDICIKDVKINEGIGQGLSYMPEECKTNNDYSERSTAPQIGI